MPKIVLDHYIYIYIMLLVMVNDVIVARACYSLYNGECLVFSLRGTFSLLALCWLSRTYILYIYIYMFVRTTMLKYTTRCTGGT